MAGNGGASRVALIAFPTDYLSRGAVPPARTTLITAAPLGGATCLELGYTFESEAFILTAFQGNQRLLHSYAKLPSGEAFFASSYYSD